MLLCSCQSSNTSRFSRCSKASVTNVSFIIMALLADGQAHLCYWDWDWAFSLPAASLHLFHGDMDINWEIFLLGTLFSEGTSHLNCLEYLQQLVMLKARKIFLEKIFQKTGCLFFWDILKNPSYDWFRAIFNFNCIWMLIDTAYRVQSPKEASFFTLNKTFNQKGCCGFPPGLQPASWFAKTVSAEPKSDYGHVYVSLKLPPTRKSAIHPALVHV